VVYAVFRTVTCPTAVGKGGRWLLMFSEELQGEVYEWYLSFLTMYDKCGHCRKLFIPRCCESA